MGRAGARAPFLALLAAAFVAHDHLPDPLAAADAAVRGADTAAVAQCIAGFAPRHAIGHLVAAALAADEGDTDMTRLEATRAARAAPWFGEVQRAAADFALVDAVERRNGAQLVAAAHAYAKAVATGAIAIEKALEALASADAPAELLHLVAGDDRARRETLVDHFARALDATRAQELAATLDREQGGGATRARAQAARRLGARLLAADRPADALRHFEEATALSGAADTLRVDRAIACFAAGQAALGATHLLRALALRAIDIESAAALIPAARDPHAVATALLEQAIASRDAAARQGASALFAAQGDVARRRALLLAGERP
ncbi:MAG: hypothetical protein EXS13_11520 [Planctomycetes bacterium]|nr:hypothetical protein [Planctomycetota bacterium]